MTARVILASTGASGAVYAERLMKALLQDGHHVDLIVSNYGARLLKEERDLPGEPRKLVEALIKRHTLDVPPDRVTTHSNSDLGASLSSGSFPVHGMAIVPASMRTVAAIASGFGATLVDRSAAVCGSSRIPIRELPA